MSESILVTDGGDRNARSTLAAVRALAAAGYRVIATIGRERSLAARSRYCSHYVATPTVGDARFAESIREVARAQGTAATVVSSDAALIALDGRGQEFINKAGLSKLAAQAGFLTPETRRIESTEVLHAEAHGFSYPIVVKLEVGKASALRLRAPEEVLAVQLDGPAVVQPYLDGAMESTAGVIRAGQLVAVVHQRYLRTWPMDCGTSCAAVTVDGDPEREKRLLKLFSGYEGIFQVQFKDGHLLDVNPRIYGSLPLAVAAGANLAALQADLLLGKAPPSKLVRGRSGVRYRWIDGDLRHMVGLLKQGRVWPAVDTLVPRANTTHSIWSWRDPMPGLLRTKFMIQKLW